MTEKRKSPSTMSFTKSAVENLPLPESGQVFVWDIELKGFGVKLIPSGRVYVVQRWVKTKDGKDVNRRKVIGRHGVITLKKAEELARKELSAMLEGQDPSAERKRKKAYSLTLSELAKEYIKKRDLKESSRADIEKHLSKSFADWADRPATQITRDKVAKRFTELSERSKAQANQAFRILRAILNYARGAHRHNDKPLMVENPVAVLSDTKVWNKVRARSGRIPTNKIGAAWNALQTLREAPDQTTISRSLADVVCFLLLTGARWSEAAQLTWDRVNLDEAWWHIPDPKNRQPVTFPLSQLAKGILEARPRTGLYVFPARSKDGYVSDPRFVFQTISRVAGVQLTPHDMRRTFRAIAGECSIELWKTKLLMNHRITQDVTIGHYTETEDLRYLEPEISLISGLIQRKAAMAASDNVVPFPAKVGGE